MSVTIDVLKFEWIRFKGTLKTQKGKNAIKTIILYICLMIPLLYGWDKLIFKPFLLVAKEMTIQHITTQSQAIQAIAILGFIFLTLPLAILKIPFWIIDPIAFYLGWDDKRKKRALPLGMKRICYRCKTLTDSTLEYRRKFVCKKCWIIKSWIGGR